MPDTTLEEAARCPKCKEPGEFAGERAIEDKSRQITRGAKLKVFSCRNTRCKWQNESWLVQVNPDGTIPPPVLRREKQFKPLNVTTEEITARVQKQLEIETKPNAELYR